MQNASESCIWFHVDLQAYTCLMHDSVCFHILRWNVECVKVLVCGPSVNSVPRVFSSRLQRPGKAQLQPSGVFTTIRLYLATRGPRPPAGSPAPLPALCLLSGSLSQNTRERRSRHQRNTPLLHTQMHKRKEETDVHLFPAVGWEMLYAARENGSCSSTDSCYRMKPKTR